jgi:predicted transcriptional regulator
MTSITIKLPEELKEKLETQARLRGKSCSAVVRDSLEKDLSVSKKQSILDKLHDLAGKGDSGISDLATNPKHMKDFGQWRK